MKNLSLLNLFKIGLVFFVFFIPLQNRDLFSFFGTRLFPARVILLGLIFLFSFYLVINWIRIEPFREKILVLPRVIFRDTVLRFLLILWLIRLVSLKNSLDLRSSLSLFLFYTSMIALYAILNFIRRNDFRFIDRLYKLHLVCLVVIGLFAILQALLTLAGVRLPGVLSGSTFIRVPGTFYDANHLPPYILTGLPVIFVLSFFEKNVGMRTIYYIISAALSVAILLTFSRSGLLSLSVIFVIFFWYFIRNRYWKKLSFLLVILFLIATLVFVSSRTTLSLVKRAVSILDINDRSTVAHGILLYGGFKVWQSSPIFGVGYGGFDNAFKKTELGREHSYFDPAKDVRLPIHSLWLEALAETGILGFSAYLMLMLSITGFLVKAFNVAKNKKDNLIITALFSSFIGILTGGIFYSYNLEFFWFFIFITLFHCQIVLDERRKEAETEIYEPEERINFTEIFPFLLIAAVALPLLIYNLSFPLLDGGREGFFAVISKMIRRTGGMGWPLWWIPKVGEDLYFVKPPLFFYLNAFIIFLYDIITASVRFWSAFFSFLSLIILYVTVRLFSTRKRAILAAFSLLALPGFLVVCRRGTFDSAVVFLSVLISLSFILSLKRSFYFVFFGFSLSLAFLLDQSAGFFFSLLSLLVILVDISFRNGFKRYRTGWLLTVPLIVLLLNGPWIVYAQKNFDGEFLRQYFSPNLKDLFYIFMLSLFPLMAFSVSGVLNRFRLIILVWFLSTLALIEVLLIPQSGNKILVDLINKRLDTDRRGTIPLVMTVNKSYDLLYYSEVPIIFTGDQSSWPYFIDKRAYFVILDGKDFTEMRNKLIENNISTRVISSEKNLLLVQKYGMVP